MTDELKRRARRVHALAHTLPRCDHATPRGELPANGIYLFFEDGERVSMDGRERDRVQRVGTHRTARRLAGRIADHYASDKNGSVFRKHIGGALLLRTDPQDPRLGQWLRQGGRSFIEVERAVSRVLHERSGFVCVRVPRADDRKDLEGGLIALLAQHPVGPPSPTWLGRNAAAREIQRAGLWNVQDIDAEPLSPDEIDQFDLRVEHTRSTWGRHDQCQ